jgi:hypothetical protein
MLSVRQIPGNSGRFENTEHPGPAEVIVELDVEVNGTFCPGHDIPERNALHFGHTDLKTTKNGSRKTSSKKTMGTPMTARRPQTRFTWCGATRGFMMFVDMVASLRQHNHVTAKPPHKHPITDVEHC